MAKRKTRKRPKASARNNDRTNRPRSAIDDPHELAQQFLIREQLLTSDEWRLRYYRGQWWEYSAGRYLYLERADLRARVTRTVRRHLENLHEKLHAAGRKKNGSEEEDEPTVKQVTRSLIGNVIQALEGMCLVPSSVDMPVWLAKQKRPEERNLIAVTNGLVDVDRLLRGKRRVTRSILTPHSPQWFSPMCLPYEFDPAAHCPLWLAFLAEVLESDSERIAVLQEWFGLCLIPDTTFQKFFMLVGEGSNGKKVILDVLETLLGEANVSHVPLEQFASQRLKRGLASGGRSGASRPSRRRR